MKIFEYAKKIKTVSTKELVESLRVNDVSLAEYIEAVERIQAEGISLDVAADSWHITKPFIRVGAVSLNHRIKPTYLNIVKFAAEKAKHINAILLKEVENSKERVWDGSTITFKQVAILDEISALESWIDYTGMCLDTLITQTHSKSPIESNLSKADIKHLNGTNKLYVEKTRDLLINTSSFEVELGNIAELEVSEEHEDIIENGENKIRSKLTNKGLGIHHLNPKYWYDLQLSKYHLYRLDVLRQNNETLSMGINLAIQKKAGEEDPHLENQIEMQREIINKNRAKMEQIVRKYD